MLAVIYVIMPVFFNFLPLDDPRRFAITALAIGVAGIITVIIYTGGFKTILKFLLFLLAATPIVIAIIWFSPGERVVSEKYYVVAMTDDMNFVEYKLPTVKDLEEFVMMIPWYETKRERIEMFKFYITVKGSEVEDEAIRKIVLGSAFSANPEERMIVYIKERLKLKDLIFPSPDSLQYFFDENGPEQMQVQPQGQAEDIPESIDMMEE